MPTLNHVDNNMYGLKSTIENIFIEANEIKLITKPDVTLIASILKLQVVWFLKSRDSKIILTRFPDKIIEKINKANGRFFSTISKISCPNSVATIINNTGEIFKKLSIY